MVVEGATLNFFMILQLLRLTSDAIQNMCDFFRVLLSPFFFFNWILAFFVIFFIIRILCTLLSISLIRLFRASHLLYDIAELLPDPVQEQHGTYFMRWCSILGCGCKLVWFNSKAFKLVQWVCVQLDTIFGWFRSNPKQPKSNRNSI